MNRETDEGEKTMAEISAMFGNISPEEFGKRMNIELSKETLKFMHDYWEEIADIPIGSMKFHIFELPFHVLCGCKEMSQKFVTHMRNNYDISKGQRCEVTYYMDKDSI